MSIENILDDPNNETLIFNSRPLSSTLTKTWTPKLIFLFIENDNLSLQNAPNYSTYNTQKLLKAHF